MATAGRSWGRYPVTTERVVTLMDRHAPLPRSEQLVLPLGNARSYGDSCLNDGGVLLAVRGLDHFIAFDPANGVLTCEAGVLFSDILDLVVPQGWFLPVTPVRVLSPLAAQSPMTCMARTIIARERSATTYAHSNCCVPMERGCIARLRKTQSGLPRPSAASD